MSNHPTEYSFSFSNLGAAPIDLMMVLIMSKVSVSLYFYKRYILELSLGILMTPVRIRGFASNDPL